MHGFGSGGEDRSRGVTGLLFLCLILGAAVMRYGHLQRCARTLDLADFLGIGVVHQDGRFFTDFHFAPVGVRQMR